MREWLRSAQGDLAITLGLASLVCLVLYGYTVHRESEFVFRYLPGNLALAWLPLIFAFLLVKLLKTHLWSSWPALAVSLGWLVFLPNSFYMVTDLLHLQGVIDNSIVTDSVTFAAFVITGLLIGFTSLYLVHRELLQRLPTNWAVGYVTAVLFLCSLAIYIGRDLRWNSWDVLISPAGMLFDLSDRLVHPSEYGTILSVSLSFFVLLGGMYLVAWRLVRLADRSDLG